MKIIPFHLLLLIGLVFTTACNAAPTATLPRAALTTLPPTTSSTQVGRTLLEYNALVKGFKAVSPIDESALAMPANASAPAHIFEGRLELLGENEGGQMDVLRGELGPEYASLPEFDFQFVQSNGYLIPTQRGAIITTHPRWNIILEPGRAWQETSDEGFSRASIPFTLVPKGGNSSFNGTLTFLFDDQRKKLYWPPHGS